MTLLLLKEPVSKFVSCVDDHLPLLFQVLVSGVPLGIFSQLSLQLQADVLTGKLV